MIYLAGVDCRTLEDYVHAISGYSGSTGMDALPGLDGLSAAKGLYVCHFRLFWVYRYGCFTWIGWIVSC